MSKQKYRGKDDTFQEQYTEEDKPLVPTQEVSPVVTHTDLNGTTKKPLIASPFKPQDPPANIITTLDCTKMSEREIAYSIASSKAIPFSEVINEELEIAHWVAFPDLVNDPATGEVKQGLRTQMALTDGRIVGSMSPFVYGDLKTYQDFVMGGHWLMPIKFIAREYKRKSGMGIFHKLEAPIRSLNILSTPRQREPKQEPQA